MKLIILSALKKLSPRIQARNPVMFPVYVGAILTVILYFYSLAGLGQSSPGFTIQICIWLWFTVIFANAAESLAESRGRAHADTLRKSKRQIIAKKLRDPANRTLVESVDATRLRKGEFVLVEADDIISADGEAIMGIATVDESSMTGESAPVIRESGGDRSAVTGGTKVLSDWLVIKITVNPGEGFLDRMIAMIESAQRQKTPNELALTLLLSALTLSFLLVCATLLPFSSFFASSTGIGEPASLVGLISLFVCLAPTTIGGLLSAIGISGMDRLLRANVIVTSGKAVEAAGDVDVLLLDKTGTITLGNRHAVEFLPAPQVTQDNMNKAALLSSLLDETPEGRSIVKLAREKYTLQPPDETILENVKFIPFTAQTRMSGLDMVGRTLRKGPVDAMRTWIREQGGLFPQAVCDTADSISRTGSTPLVVVENKQVLGVIHLKDIVKGGIKERFGELRKMGIATVMVTGDNPLTAAAIAAEAGVDDFLAEATPEAKLKLIRDYQSKGHLVAMTGDGTNDAPALAQADVAVAMQSGTQAAKEAGNMVDLDSNPTKMLDIVRIGKEILITRGALTTFSIANDLAKYFAIIPAIFMNTCPSLQTLNVMHLATPESAILSAVIFNALIIVLLIPLALLGVSCRADSASRLLRRNLSIYGLGGVFTPFVGIKLIDIMLVWLNLV